MGKRKSLTERVWEKIDNREDGCWLWMGLRHKQGYGKISYKGKTLLAHRVVYALICGPIPKGMCVLHKCDNPPCCRYDHFWLGTRAENNHDMAWKGRAASGDKNYVHRHPETVRGERNGSVKLTSMQVKEIISQYLDGKVTQQELAQRYGVSDSLVSAILHRQAWPEITATDHRLGKNFYASGERIKQAKLTYQKVTEIRRLYKNRSMSQVQIAKLFCVSKNLIRLIINGQIWKGAPV